MGTTTRTPHPTAPRHLDNAQDLQARQGCARAPGPIRRPQGRRDPPVAAFRLEEGDQEGVRGALLVGQEQVLLHPAQVLERLLSLSVCVLITGHASSRGSRQTATPGSPFASMQLT